MTNESSKEKKTTSAEETLRQRSFIELAQALTAQKSNAAGRPLTYCLTTFGCQMNEKQSEAVAGIMDEIGYVRQDNEEADVVLYNTCTVRENANLKVYGRLGHLHSLKDRDPDMKIILFGCMMQEQHVVDKIRKSYPFVDLVFGTHNIFKFAELFYEMLQSDQQIVDIWEGTDQIVEDLPTERNYTFKSGVNIMFGCNNFCSYCIVPYVRGRERSRRPEEIIAEIRKLAQDGVTEVMLLGQNVNSYGRGLPREISFAELLRQVETVPGIRRIRFMTSHPKDLSEELIETMAASDKICRHLHLPLQSGSSRILKRMNRKYDKEQYLRLVEDIRRAMPDIALTTDIIVGFPGETEEDFQETMDVVRRVEYDSAFTFLYSKRSGTPAASFADQVPEDVAKERFDRLLALVQEIGRKKAKALEESEAVVLVEEKNAQAPEMVPGRLDNNSVVHLKGCEADIGHYIPVRLAECRGFYYIGERLS